MTKAVLALEVAVRHGDAAVELDLGLVDGVARVRVQHLVARVHQGQHELADDGLAPRLDGDVLRAVAEAVRGAHVGGDSRPQRRDTGVRAVAGLAVLDRLERRLHDVARCRDVHVTQVERVHLVALGGEGGRLGRHREGGLGSQTGDAPGDPGSDQGCRLAVS